LQRRQDDEQAEQDDSESAVWRERAATPRAAEIVEAPQRLDRGAAVGIAAALEQARPVDRRAVDERARKRRRHGGVSVSRACARRDG
jgi:hypothetical protein